MVRDPIGSDHCSGRGVSEPGLRGGEVDVVESRIVGRGTPTTLLLCLGVSSLGPRVVASPGGSLSFFPFTAGPFRRMKFRRIFRFYRGYLLGRIIHQFSVATFRASIASAHFRSHILRFQSLYSFREVIYDRKVKRSGFELDLVPHEFCPFVPSGVYPTHKIEVVDVFEGAEVRTLLSSMRKYEV